MRSSVRKSKSKSATKKKSAAKSKRTVTAPAARSTILRNAGGGSARPVTVTRREFLLDVTQTASWSLNSFPINPGLDVPFPWLSGMAVLYEEYKIRSLRYCYVARCGTSAPGSITMAIEQDVSDADPTDDRVLNSYSGAVSSTFWADFDLPVKDLKVRTGNLYVRSGPISAGDLRLNDFGKLYWATSGGTDGLAAGQLWVEYTIDFFVPQMETIVQDLNMSVPKNVPLGTGGNPAPLPWVDTGTGLQNILTEFEKVVNRTEAASSVFNKLVGSLDAIPKLASSLPTKQAQAARAAGLDPTEYLLEFPHAWEGFLVTNVLVVAKNGAIPIQMGSSDGIYGNLTYGSLIPGSAHYLLHDQLTFPGFPDMTGHIGTYGTTFVGITPYLLGKDGVTSVNSQVSIILQRDSPSYCLTSTGVAVAPNMDDYATRGYSFLVPASGYLMTSTTLIFYIKATQGDCFYFSAAYSSGWSPAWTVVCEDGTSNSPSMSTLLLPVTTGNNGFSGNASPGLLGSRPAAPRDKRTIAKQLGGAEPPEGTNISTSSTTQADCPHCQRSMSNCPSKAPFWTS